MNLLQTAFVGFSSEFRPVSSERSLFHFVSFCSDSLYIEFVMTPVNGL